MKISWSRILTTSLAGLAVYALYRYVTMPRTYLAPEIREKLPIAKGLPTVHDFDGNYDIDGVSYDSEGTVVSGDASKPVSDLI